MFTAERNGKAAGRTKKKKTRQSIEETLANSAQQDASGELALLFIVVNMIERSRILDILRNIADDMVQDTMIENSSFFVHISKTSPEKIESIRDWGRERAVPASGRPIGEETLPKAERNHVRRVLTRH